MGDLVSRYWLYKYAADNFEDCIDFFIPDETGENKQKLIDMFKDSADAIKLLEKTDEQESNPVNQKISKYEFLQDMRTNLERIKNDDFKKYLQKRLVERIEENRKEDDKLRHYRDWFLICLDIIATYQNRVIEKLLKPTLKTESSEPVVPSPWYFKNEKRIKTFLSYAYEDKGLSLCLFLYFFKNGGFLYVDWMWNGRISDPDVLKENIRKNLDNSEQLLFLRSARSEFSKSHNLMIKPWCAWEIGNYYDIHPNKKYIISFYKSSSIHPIIEKFKPMLKVRSGRIISK